MTRSRRSVHLALLLVILWANVTGVASPPRAEPVAATIESTLTTRDAQVRQLAFDGDGASFFESDEPPGADDHFTLVLDRPVRLRSIAAVTGRADGGDAVRSGTLEVSADGTAFPRSPGSSAARPGADPPTGPSGRSGSGPPPRTDRSPSAS